MNNIECAVQARYLDRTQKPLECEHCIFHDTEMCECKEDLRCINDRQRIS